MTTLLHKMGVGKFVALGFKTHCFKHNVSKAICNKVGLHLSDYLEEYLPSRWPIPDAHRVSVVGHTMLIESVEIECSRNRSIDEIVERYVLAMWFDLDAVEQVGTAALLYVDFMKGQPPVAVCWHLQAPGSAVRWMMAKAKNVGCDQIYRTEDSTRMPVMPSSSAPSRPVSSSGS